MEKIRIGVSGVGGRMGRLIAEEVLLDSALELVVALESKGHKSVGKKAGDALGLRDRGPLVSDSPSDISLCKVFIEFTTPQATAEHLFVCRDKGAGMVIGTTALGKNTEAQIKAASSKIPIVYSPNMSAGVNLLFRLIKESASILGKDFDIEVIEAHHRRKKDKPSGTAKKLRRIIEEARGDALSSDSLHSLRAGEIVGEHTVLFAGPGERIELIHRVDTRRTFARGAIKAAKFIAKAPPGLYTMEDVLFGERKCQ